MRTAARGRGLRDDILILVCLIIFHRKLDLGQLAELPVIYKYPAPDSPVLGQEFIQRPSALMAAELEASISTGLDQLAFAAWAAAAGVGIRLACAWCKG